MNSDTETLEIRLSAETCRTLEKISARQKRRPEELLAQYAEVIARESRFPQIEFRSTATGFVPYVQGTRTPVWLVVDLLRQHGGNLTAAANLHEWPEHKFKAAADYASAFPEEIEHEIREARNITAETVLNVRGA